MTPVEWLLGNDTGISSKTICAVMTGSALRDPFNSSVPHDSDDFGRCYRLLKHFPEWRLRLPEIGFIYPLWQPLVMAWDELTALYELFCDEHGKVSHELYLANKAASEQFHTRIRELREDGMRTDGWVEVCSGSWRRATKQVEGA